LPCKRGFWVGLIGPKGPETGCCGGAQRLPRPASALACRGALSSFPLRQLDPIAFLPLKQPGEGCRSTELLGSFAEPALLRPQIPGPNGSGAAWMLLGDQGLHARGFCGAGGQRAIPRRPFARLLVGLATGHAALFPLRKTLRIQPRSLKDLRQLRRERRLAPPSPTKRRDAWFRAAWPSALSQLSAAALRPRSAMSLSSAFARCRGSSDVSLSPELPPCLQQGRLRGGTRSRIRPPVGGSGPMGARIGLPLDAARSVWERGFSAVLLEEARPAHGRRRPGDRQRPRPL